MDSPVIGVAIGVVFVFAALALAVSIITEAVSRFMGLRGEYLLRGLRSMLDGESTFQLTDFGLREFGALLGRTGHSKQSPTDDSRSPGRTATLGGPAAECAFVTRVMDHPLVRETMSQGRGVPTGAGDRALSRPQRRQLPSYLSSRTFARALVDIAIPDAAGRTTLDDIRSQLDGIENKQLRERLVALLAGAHGDVDEFRKAIEQWYDDHMARVSGWYKRHVRWISFAIGFVLVVAFNLSLIGVATALYSDQVLRESVVTQAVQAADCNGRSPGDCLAAVRSELQDARDAGLPWGWGTVSSCTDTGADCTFAERHGLADPQADGFADALFLLLLIVGYVGMLVALVPGARFWVDLLKRMGSLRETGPVPPPST